MIQAFIASDVKGEGTAKPESIQAVVPKTASSLHGQSRYLSEKGVSAYTGLSVSTLQKWRHTCHTGGIPYSKIGKRVVYDVHLVDQFMSAHSININNM